MSHTAEKDEIEALPLALPEGIDDEKYVIATYLISCPRDWPIDKVAMAIAVEQSTGTWVRVPGETVELRKKTHCQSCSDKRGS